MKISNPDMIKLSEIKQYFLEPPHSFKLYTHALPQAEEAINIISKYPRLLHSVDNMKQSLQVMHDLQKNMDALQKEMKIFARLFNSVNQ